MALIFDISALFKLCGSHCDSRCDEKGLNEEVSLPNPIQWPKNQIIFNFSKSANNGQVDLNSERKFAHCH